MDLPDHVVLERLPVMSMDEEFSALLSDGDPEAVKAVRAARLEAIT